jgi:hypothetical protein
MLLNENAFDPHEIRELIVHCSKIALTILHKRYENYLNHFAHQGITLQDIATDAIAPLFIKTKPNDVISLKRALDNWNQPINNEADANFFLFQIISSRIEQEITKKLKEADPFFGKILRSINHLVETNKIKKGSWFGISYIFDTQFDLVTQKPIEEELLEKLPSKMFVGSNDFIINNLFQYIKAETDYFPAIPLNALIRKVKNVNGSFLQQRNSEFAEVNFEEKLDVDLVINESLKILDERIDNFYFEKGKLDSHETIIFKKVLYELATDLKDGGISRGLYEYLNIHMINLTKEDFYNKYHSVLDYLLRQLKKEVAQKIEEFNN